MDWDWFRNDLGSNFSGVYKDLQCFTSPLPNSTEPPPRPTHGIKKKIKK